MADPTLEGHGAKGVELFKAGNAVEALPELRQAVHEHPDHFELRMFFGLALAKADKWADAESQFATACDLNGKSAEAAYFQAVAIARRGRRLEAHSMAKVALALNPEHKGAKALEEATAEAAETITTTGSSVRMPGGANLSVGDWKAIEAEAARLEGRPAPQREEPADDVAAALAELDPEAKREPARGAPKPGGKSTGPQIKMAHQKGCLGSLLAAAGLLALAAACLAYLPL